MTEQNSRLRAALALVELATHPELDALTWSVGPLGLLSGGASLNHDGSDLVLACADLMGCDTSDIRTSQFTGKDGSARDSAQFFATWRGVSVDVWVSYPTPVTTGDEALAGGAR